MTHDLSKPTAQSPGRPDGPRRCVGVMLLLFIAIGCQPSEPWTSENPEFALQAFVNALHSGNQTMVWEFLNDETRAELEALAAQTEAELGEPVAPQSLLYRVWVPSAVDIERFETTARSQDGDVEHASVTIYYTLGPPDQVDLTRRDGRWQINALQPRSGDDVPRPAPLPE